ncbi:glycosyltransferase [Bernardetia sp.]|uniref:glycosyltransferase n=1 Tax=Bernardetia sp. TaxID=1937974 RepID=UPI0025B8647E|nr:glycosyltransferase [Bernardetia sp.]
MKKYLPKGSKIYLMTLEQPHFKMSEEQKEQVKKELQNDFDIYLLDFSYYRFGLRSILNWVRIVSVLVKTVFTKNIRFIHPFCMPAGAGAYLVSKFTGKKLIIDSFEPHAEAMLESNTWKKNSLAFQILWNLEKLQTSRASAFVPCVNEMQNYAKNRYRIDISDRCLESKPACVDVNLFDFNKRKNPKLLEELGLQDKIVSVYAGKFGSSYLEKEIFDFWKVCHDFWGDTFRVLILTSHKEEEINNYCRESNLDRNIVTTKFVFHEHIPSYIGLGDFGVTPFKPAASKRYGTPIKTGEYWAMGLPVVITPHISDDSDTIKKYQIGSIMNEFTEEEYLRIAKEINELLVHKEETNLHQKIRDIAEKYRGFQIAHRVYDELYGEKGRAWTF